MDPVSEIKDRLSVEDVVAEYVQLKRAGRNFKGLSPFNSEKTPSFVVSPEKQIWHDFSSGKGGDIFSFIQEVEGLGFRDALELLANKAGVNLPDYEKSSSKKSGRYRENLFDILNLAARFYQSNLKNSKDGLSYLFEQRFFDKKVVLDFRLGYSPNNKSSLCGFLKSKGFDIQDILTTGLATKGYRGERDMFRGRIMIPLCDPTGRVVGFTARKLGSSDNGPKYINTPSTVLYDKSRQVYGLHLAKEFIRKNDYAVVVEGNLDVISSHKVDVRNVVAIAGTALTEHHLKMISRFSANIRLAFDGDRAGVSATERAIFLSQKLKVNISVISLPNGLDPDDLIKSDKEEWQSAIDKYVYGVDWLIDRYKMLQDTKTGQGKKLFTDKALVLIQALQDEVEREHYIKLVADITGTDAKIVKIKLGSLKKDKSKLKKVKISNNNTEGDLVYKNLEISILAIAMTYPGILQYIDLLIKDMFLTAASKDLFQQIADYYKNITDDKAELAKRDLKYTGEYAKIASLQFDELYHSLEFSDIKGEATRLQERLIAKYVKKQKIVLSEKLSVTRGDDASSIIEQDRELNMLLNRSRKQSL